MARAKHTNRTDARRRYRAEQAAVLAVDASGDDLDDAAAEQGPAKAAAARSVPARGGPARAGIHPEPARPGIMASLRAAFTPLDLRGDLVALPQIVRHWALLASAAVAVAATAVFITSTNELGASLDFTLSDPLAGKTIGTGTNIAYLVVSLFVAPPPAAGAFLIGFTAKRGSWVGGLVYGLVAAACYAAILLSPAGRLLAGNSPTDVQVLNAVVMGPIGALLFASAAAWYRRFLNLANPNRGRRPGQANSKQKPRPATAKAGSRSR